MINVNELRKSTMKDLRKQFDELDKQIMLETFALQTRKSTKTKQLRDMKKDRARIATIMTELKTISHLKKDE